VDLVDVRWAGGKLSGTSRVVAGDPYELYLTEPGGFRLATFECPGATIAATKREGVLIQLTLRPAESRTLAWQAGFENK
jgi:hypothetical protein